MASGQGRRNPFDRKISQVHLAQHRDPAARRASAPGRCRRKTARRSGSRSPPPGASARYRCRSPAPPAPPARPVPRRLVRPVRSSASGHIATIAAAEPRIRLHVPTTTGRSPRACSAPRDRAEPLGRPALCRPMRRRAGRQHRVGRLQRPARHAVSQARSGSGKQVIPAAASWSRCRSSVCIRLRAGIAVRMRRARARCRTSRAAPPAGNSGWTGPRSADRRRNRSRCSARRSRSSPGRSHQAGRAVHHDVVEPRALPRQPGERRRGQQGDLGRPDDAPGSPRTARTPARNRPARRA